MCVSARNERMWAIRNFCRPVLFSRKSLLTGEKAGVRLERREHDIISCPCKYFAQAGGGGVAETERRYPQQFQHGANHGREAGIGLQKVSPLYLGAGGKKQRPVRINVVETGGCARGRDQYNHVPPPRRPGKCFQNTADVEVGIGDKGSFIGKPAGKRRRARQANGNKGGKVGAAGAGMLLEVFQEASCGIVSGGLDTVALQVVQQRQNMLSLRRLSLGIVVFAEGA